MLSTHFLTTADINYVLELMLIRQANQKNGIFATIDIFQPNVLRDAMIY